MQDLSAAAIRLGLRLTYWTTGELWMASAGIGGSFSHHDIDEIAAGRQLATPVEHDILATALNEELADEGQDHPVRYWADLLHTEAIVAGKDRRRSLPPAQAMEEDAVQRRSWPERRVP
jgi:hypothetical protein